MKELLRSFGITPTSTRVRVWSFLENNTDHPTAEDILTGLTSQGDRISRATVYNTLNLFHKKGLVIAVHGSDDVVHFDPYTQSHAHFQCEECGKLWNIPLNETAIDMSSMEGADIHTINVLIKGSCGECKQKLEENNME